MIDKDIETDDLSYPRWMPSGDGRVDHLYTGSFDSGYYQTAFCGTDDKMNTKIQPSGNKCGTCVYELRRFYMEARA